MRVAIVTESFLPQVNGVTNSVLRVLEHLRRGGHQALVVAPGAGAGEHHGTPVVRVSAVDVPMVTSLPIGVPSPRVLHELADFQPDVVHLASPFVLGAYGLRAARKIDVPTVEGEERTLEVHLFDHDGDLYGRVLEVEFVKCLRGERKFESLEALKEQIGRDAEEAMYLLRGLDHEER